MKSFLCKLFLTCGSAIGLLSTTPNSANAAFFFDFESPIPPDLIISAGVPLTGDLISIDTSIETRNNNSYLRLKDKQSPIEGGSVSGFFINQDQIFDNVKVSALLNPAGNSNDEIAVLARVDLSSLSAYAATIDFSNGELLLAKIIGGQAGDRAIILANAFNILPALDRAYFVELEVIENKLVSRFFDASGSVELFSLSATDTNNPLITGTSGVAVDISQVSFPNFNDPNNATFDNFRSRSISVPESSNLLSLLAVSVIVTSITLKRKICIMADFVAKNNRLKS
jgi:hypothetical protein